MNSKIINVAKDFSPFPGGRFRADGPNSGERFREDFLVPTLRAADRVVIVLDGTEGFGSSFLDEAFGGLVRNSGFDKSVILGKLKFESVDRAYVEEILDFIRTA